MNIENKKAYIRSTNHAKKSIRGTIFTSENIGIDNGWLTKLRWNSLEHPNAHIVIAIGADAGITPHNLMKKDSHYHYNLYRSFMTSLPDFTGEVYGFRDANIPEAIKVGSAFNTRDRMKKSQSCPSLLHTKKSDQWLDFVIFCFGIPHTTVEKIIHKELGEPAERNEWFNANVTDVQNLIKRYTFPTGIYFWVKLITPSLNNLSTIMPSSENIFSKTASFYSLGKLQRIEISDHLIKIVSRHRFHVKWFKDSRSAQFSFEEGIDEKLGTILERELASLCVHDEFFCPDLYISDRKIHSGELFLKIIDFRGDYNCSGVICDIDELFYASNYDELVNDTNYTVAVDLIEEFEIDSKSRIHRKGCSPLGSADDCHDELF